MLNQHFKIDLSAEIARARARSEVSELITIKQAAQMLGVTVRTVRRREAAGQMPERIKHGRNKKYRRANIEALAKSRGDAS
jgi:predicted DNA-binding transcriptional regulator AlpA